MNTFEKAFKEVKTLVKNFKENEKYYLSPSYSEIDARRDFIDKFFEALGWDVYHNTQKNPYEQEVRVEKNVAVGKAQKRADYSFCISPNFRDTKFYVEAKKPSKDLNNSDYYFLAIRYGWNANTPIVILTDFEEFHIIDSRFKPDIRTALDRQIERYHYSEYTDKEKLSRIYYLLSREAVENSSIEKRAAELPKPRGKAVQKGLLKGGYQSIDVSFLEELDEIRLMLAKIFKKGNQGLTSEELTEATQRTIDRLVFMRFLEDKLIEGEHYVSEFGKKNSAWKDFIATSKRFDVKYNGIVFKNHPIIDSPTFKEADDIYFRKICEDISYENTPYDFNAIPIYILGSIYERFLGKIIHATNKQVRIEEKPEVRKAGGVFYTVLYIVRYIVDNTVGKIIEGKTPKEISKLRFIDISCGSGTFLIVIFDTLLHYIGKWYQEHPEQAKKDGCIFKDGQWVLSLKQKQEILLNNIYGVDIDYQAVEVTQLSLFLKLLEDETTATANEMQVLFKEKILPDLSKNIVCGNSLIGTDIYDGSMFPSDEQRKINAMNFEDVFPEIMKNGGFDAIVGNPPYVRIHLLNNRIIDYFVNHYQVAKGQVDLYSIFIERSIKLLNNKGRFSYIVPRFLKYNLDSELVRRLLLSNFIENLTEVGMPFKGVNTECIVFILSKKDTKYFKTQIYEYYPNSKLTMIKEIEQNFFEKMPSCIFNTIITNDELILINKILKNSVKLESIAMTKRGMEIGKVAIKENKTGINVLLGGEVKKYSFDFNDTYLNSKNSEAKRLKEFSEQDKLLIRRVSNCLIATFDNDKYYFIKNLYSLISKQSNIKFLLGLINSTLLNFYFKKYFTTKKEDIFPEIQSYHINALPICKVNLENNSEKQSHDKIVQLVDQILEAKKQLQKVTTDKDKTYYKRRCETLDRQIDQLVYELYGLTEEEIRIVEGEG